LVRKLEPEEGTLSITHKEGDMDRTIDGHDCKNEATFVKEENKKSEDFCRGTKDKD